MGLTQHLFPFLLHGFCKNQRHLKTLIMSLDPKPNWFCTYSQGPTSAKNSQEKPRVSVLVSSSKQIRLNNLEWSLSFAINLIKCIKKSNANWNSTNESCTTENLYSSPVAFHRPNYVLYIHGVTQLKILLTISEEEVRLTIWIPNIMMCDNNNNYDNESSGVEE